MLKRIGILAVVLAVSFSACDWVDEHDEHTEAEGLILRIDGVDSVTVREAQVTGRLLVSVGETTPLVQVVFLDHDGDEIRAADIEEDSKLAWQVLNPQVASVSQPTGQPWAFRLEGTTVDTTSLRLMLMHGDHADFTTPWIPVEVVP
jgi:hypothetical protein